MRELIVNANLMVKLPIMDMDSMDTGSLFLTQDRLVESM